MPYPSDENLIQKAKKGDKEAYRELFDRHSDNVLNYIARYLRDRQKAEEVVNDTFLKVYEHLSSYEEKGRFLAWVYTIALNFARRELRKKIINKEVSMEAHIDSTGEIRIKDVISDNSMRPDDAVIMSELNKAIEEALSGMDEKYRSVILLCDMQDHSYDEAAYILKCTKNAVGVRLIRARKLLREELRKRGHLA